MTHNPYATPNSDVRTTSDQPICLYSPMQAGAGAFLGGPVGLIYFLRDNFLRLGKEEQARKTMAAGVALILGLLVILPFLPDGFPSLPFTLAYVITAVQVAEHQQVSKQQIKESPQYEFQSNWRVFGYGMLCLIGSAILVMGPIALLVELGLIA